MHYAFNRQFEKLRAFYTSLLEWALEHRRPVLAGFGIFVVGSLGLVHFIGSDFFPTVDSGQMRLHARAPAGTRHRGDGSRSSRRSKHEIRDVIPAA